jgi:thiamine transporter ThiT
MWTAGLSGCNTQSTSTNFIQKVALTCSTGKIFEVYGAYVFHHTSSLVFLTEFHCQGRSGWNLVAVCKFSCTNLQTHHA